MFRRLSFTLCILTVLILSACQPPKPAPTVTSTPSTPVALAPTPMVETIVNADGALASTRPTLGLSFQVSGRVVEVLVRPGETVKQGQVLARLDTLTLQNTLRDATAQLEQARFDLDKAKRDADAGTNLAAAAMGLQAAQLGVINAQGTLSSTLLRSDVTADVRQAKFWSDFWQSEVGDAWLRLNERPNSEGRRAQYEELGARAARETNRMLQITQDADNTVSAARRGVASAQQTYLSALANYNSLKNGDPVRQAELQVQLRETAVTRAQMDLANAELKAPWDGMISTVDIAPGSQAGGAPVMTLVDVKNLQLVTNNLSERDLGRVAIGQKATIALKAYPDVKLTGKVAAIAPLSGQAVGDAATFAVRIDLDPTDLALRPGMTGQVQIVVK